MKLPLLKDLGTAHRGDPCQEYPGTYIVYQDGQEVGRFVEMEDDVSALALAKELANKLRSRTAFTNVHICWDACDDDPRIGQVWFTPFYTLDP